MKRCRSIVFLLFGVLMLPRVSTAEVRYLEVRAIGGDVFLGSTIDPESGWRSWDFYSRVIRRYVPGNGPVEYNWTIEGLPDGITVKGLDTDSPQLLGAFSKTGTYEIHCSLTIEGVTSSDSSTITVWEMDPSLSSLIHGSENEIVLREGDSFYGNGDSVFRYWNNGVSFSYSNDESLPRLISGATTLDVSWEVSGLPEGMYTQTFVSSLPKPYYEILNSWLPFGGAPIKAGDYAIHVTAKTGFEEVSRVYAIKVLSSAPALEIIEDSAFVRQTVDHPFSDSPDRIWLDHINPGKGEPRFRIIGLPYELNFSYDKQSRDLILEGPWPNPGTHEITIECENQYGVSQFVQRVKVASRAPVRAENRDYVVKFDRFEYQETGIYVDADGYYEFSVKALGDLPFGIRMSHDLSGGNIYFKGVASKMGEYDITLVVSNIYGETIIPVTVVVGQGNLFSLDTHPAGHLVYSEWMGFLDVRKYPWIYNFELGWLYVWEGAENQDAIWFYHVGESALGWIFGGRNLDGFFYFETEPNLWSWRWLYTGTIDVDEANDDSPVN